MSTDAAGSSAGAADAPSPPRAGIARMRAPIVGVALAPVALAGAALAALHGWRGATDAALLELALVMLAALGLGAALGFAVFGRLASRIGEPLVRLRETVDELAAGDLGARTGLAGDDEASEAGRALDRFLDRRIAALDRAARESEELNDSVIAIMQAVGTIASTKDLTVRVPVTENVTGAIADALNMLTDETRRVLLNVSAVSQDVAHATVAVKSQSDNASQAAAREQREVELAARELAAAAAALDVIAERARACRSAAERAARATADAMHTVGGTVQGIVHARALIRETEKRMKRLGERAQEIGQVVGLINGIAERTGILALNASMQAAASGEAGRGFAGVADEVKRLSETARDATSQIARLVGAIQAETNDTVVAMNQAITQVVEISRLAGEAGDSMRRNQEQTSALAASVHDIAQTSAEQAKVGAGLQERARIIQEASGETAQQLAQQAKETLRLVECAKALVDEVRAFKVGAS